MKKTITFLALLLAINLMAQRTIQGTVKDEKGEPCIGASIAIKDTNKGAVTDIDGQFRLDIPKEKTILIVSYTLYVTQNIDVSERDTLFNIVLKDMPFNDVIIVTNGIKKDKKSHSWSPDLLQNLDSTKVVSHVFQGTKTDSVRLAINIQKQDTLWIERFHLNGLLASKTWKRDSVFYYDFKGQVTEKRFKFSDYRTPDDTSFFAKYHGFVDAYYSHEDSLLSFYPNGQLKLLQTKTNKTSYSETGNIIEQVTCQKVQDYKWLVVHKDSVSTTQISSLDTQTLWQHDTLFYPNGRLLSISSYDNKKRLDGSQSFYNSNGDLIHTIIADSAVLVPFKNNVLCAYGLMNNKGDIIVSPRYNRIDPLKSHYFVAYDDSRTYLLNGDGSIVPTPAAETFDLVDDLSYESKRGQTSYIFLFSFKIGDKYGLIDQTGAVVLPPQYPEIRNAKKYDDVFYLSFNDYMAGYYKNGVSIFPKEIICNRECDKNGNFLIFTEKRNKKKLSDNYITTITKYGLGNLKGDILLDCQFEYIATIYKSDLLSVSTKQYKGLFDTKNKRWVFDTSEYKIDFRYEKNGYGGQDLISGFYTLFHSEKTKKYGVFDRIGQIVVPCIFDTVSIINENTALFVVKNKDEYQLYSPSSTQKFKTYSYLAHGEFILDNSREIMPVFVAKQNDKWGMIDSNEQIIKPFTAQYACKKNGLIYFVEDEEIAPFYHGSFLEKRSIDNIFKYRAYYQETLITDLIIEEESDKIVFNKDKKNIEALSPLDEADKKLYFDRTGKIIAPPQYRIIRYNKKPVSCYLIENEKKNRKIVFDDWKYNKWGDIMDFSYDYFIRYIRPDCDIVLITDKTEDEKWYKSDGEKRFGVIKKSNGQVLSPCTNYDVTIGDYEKGVYFVRPDTTKTTTPLPNLVPFAIWDISGSHSTNRNPNRKQLIDGLDGRWFMYNANGQLLDNTAFRFPIDFKNGIGIGLKENRFGLYSSDGRVIAPPQYKNIRWDEFSGIFYLFDNQIADHLTLSLINKEGEIIVKNGRYQSITPFYSQYALFNDSKGRFGLIDTSGKEIMATQELYRFSKGNFWDSLNLYNAKLLKQIALIEEKEDAYGSKKQELRQQIHTLPCGVHNIEIYTADKFKSREAYNERCNRIIHELLSALFWDRNLVKIDLTDEQYEREGMPRNYIYEEGNCEDYLAFLSPPSDKTQSLLLDARSGGFGFTKNDCINLYKKNEQWQRLWSLDELLNLTNENYKLLNKLFLEKVAALKNVHLDCNNPDTMLEQYKNIFFIARFGY